MRWAFDLAVRPMVHDFIYTSALRMSRRELLDGAAQAARVVAGQYQEAVGSGEVAPLRHLLESSSLDVRLHDHLCAEVRRGHEMGEASSMAETVAEQMRHLQEAPVLESLLLVVGAQRAGFEGVGRHRLGVGSQMVIVGQPGQPGEGLWRQHAQVQLLQEHGCTVQMKLRFEAAGPPTLPQLYTFEASRTGEDLLDEDPYSVPREAAEGAPSEVSFSLVDMNGILRGSRFWATAARVQSPYNLFDYSD